MLATSFKITSDGDHEVSGTTVSPHYNESNEESSE